MTTPELRRVLSALLGAALCACGGPAAPAHPEPAPGGTGAEIDLTRPERERPAWPPGLVPCAKDAPAGESCAAGPAGSARANAELPPEDTTVWKVPVTGDDPRRGPAEALVTVVVFSDFECPFCKRFTTTLDRLLTELPEDVRVVWKDYPLPAHEHAEAAAELARFARSVKGDAGFWAAHDLLYAAQPDLGDPAFRGVAEKLGLGWPAASAALRGARYGAAIRADVALGDRVDLQATPTLFVNGRKLVGAQPYERVRALVDAELSKARELVASGVRRTDAYAHIVARGKEIAVPSDVAPAPP